MFTVLEADGTAHAMVLKGCAVGVGGQDSAQPTFAGLLTTRGKARALAYENATHMQFSLNIDVVRI